MSTENPEPTATSKRDESGSGDAGQTDDAGQNGGTSDDEKREGKAEGGAVAQTVVGDLGSVATVETVATRETRRWAGVNGVALLLAGAAVLLQSPPLLLTAVVGVGYAAYAASGSVAEPALALQRELSAASAQPGEEIEVTVRVRNRGDGTLADVRLVDGVPSGMAVVDGSPRLGTALRTGRTATFTYTVEATRGEHGWEPLQAILRDPAGTREREVLVSTEQPCELQCTPTLDATADLPLRGLTTPYAGRVSTDTAGTGQEFYATREYRPGDPQRRIDWNRWARTGELATQQFREERAAAVVLLVDAREEAYVARREGTENAVERSVDAAARTFAALTGTGDRVGVAALSPLDCWLSPGGGPGHLARGRELFATHPAFSPTPPAGSFPPTAEFARLRRRLPPDVQVILYSPLVDEFAAVSARKLEAAGHHVTVLSPDPTAEDSPGRRLEAVRRRNRISSLRRAGIRVVDWGAEPLSVAVERSSRRWSR